ncbi:MAG TPA: MCE family protein [Acidimicrobiales bacterium]|jgi:phospholipid/cholesterol/gamma-HCH transport system substrate-binding protein|nr:MCE family protein [Acidimicrobiales bacterium]
MKAFTDRNPRRIGIVVVVVTAVAVLSVFAFNGSTFSSGYTVKARFSTAAGMGPNANVLLAGVAVGKVTSVNLNGNHVTVDMTVNQGVVLPQNTTASISVETLLGQLVVDLKPVSGWSHPLGDGALLTKTSVPVEFQNIQNEAGGLLTKTDATAINQLISSLATITQGKQQQVAQIISGLNGFTGVINQRQTQVTQLIAAANTLSQTVATHDSQLGSAIDNLTTVIGALAQKGTDLGNLIDNTQQAAGQINTLVTNNRPQLQAVVAQLQSVLGVLSQHQLDLAQGVSSAAAAVTGFSSIGYSGTTPVSWGNIFFNVLGSTPLEGVLGSCGTLDLVLTQALGPDPLPCSQQNGPLVGTLPAPATVPATTVPATAGTNAGSTTTTAPAPATTTTTAPSLGNGIAGILGLGNQGSGS